MAIVGTNVGGLTGLDGRVLLRGVPLGAQTVRVLRVGFRLGAFDPPESNPYNKIPMSVVRSTDHLALALKTAQESITLLSNHNDFLPLKREAIHSIAVIGPAGDTDYETGKY